MKLTKKGLIREVSTFNGVAYSIKEIEESLFSITVNNSDLDCEGDSWFFVNSYVEAKADIKFAINNKCYSK